MYKLAGQPIQACTCSGNIGHVLLWQAGPPSPAAAEVFIEERPALDVYVSSFGGWTTGATYLEHAAAVTKALEDNGISIAGDFYYTAGYDSPFRLRNRHSEVWIPAGKPSVAKAA